MLRIAQASLQGFKRAFISKDVLGVVMGMLEEPLTHVGVARSEDDNFSIELCLTLLRNVLSIKDPTPGSLATSTGDQLIEMHEELLVLLQETLMLDVLLLLAQDVHARENAKLNLLLVEIFHSIVGQQEPSSTIAANRERARKTSCAREAGRPSQSTKSRGSLTSVLAREKLSRELVSGQMHRWGLGSCTLDGSANEGGSFLIELPSGKPWSTSRATGWPRYKEVLGTELVHSCAGKC